MADKKLNAVSTATDGAYIYAEDASGNQIKISKADLASVVAGMVINKTITVNAHSEYEFDFIGGVISVSTAALMMVSAIVNFPMYDTAAAAVSNIAGDAFVGGNVTTTNKFAFWRAENKCRIRNNFSSNITIIYSELAVRR